MSLVRWRREGSGATAFLLALVFVASDGAAGQIPDTTSMEPEAAVDSVDGGMLTVADTLPVADSLPTPDWTAPMPQAAQTALGYVTEASPDTPGGMGLLEVARQEAEIALQHARLAGRDSTDLANMTRHMTHVLHALDPTEVGAGPGLGYGVRPAARAMTTRLQEAARVEGVPGVLRFHAPFAVRAARGAEARATEAVTVARSVQRAASAAEGRRLLRRLAEVVRTMTYGTDSDGDGRVGHTEDEGGVAQVAHHLELVRRVAAR